MSKRRVKRKLKKLPIIILLILLVGGVVFGCFYSRNLFSEKKPKKEKKKVEEKKEVKTKKTYEAKVFMVGDSLIHWGAPSRIWSSGAAL